MLRSITSSFASNSRSVACNALCDAEAQEREHVVENWARIYLGLLEHNVETMQRQSAEQCWLSTLHEAFESHIQEEFAIRRGAVEKEEQQARCDTLLVPYHSGMCSICEQCWNESVVSDVITLRLQLSAMKPVWRHRFGLCSDGSPCSYTCSGSLLYCALPATSSSLPAFSPVATLCGRTR